MYVYVHTYMSRFITYYYKNILISNTYICIHIVNKVFKYCNIRIVITDAVLSNLVLKRAKDVKLTGHQNLLLFLLYNMYL